MSRIKLTANNTCHTPVKGGARVEALIETAHQGVAAIATWMAGGGDINLVADPSNGITALHALARRGASARDLAAMGSLLAAGADPNLRNGRGETPLLRATLNRMPEMARLLVAHGADPRIADRNELTPRARMERQTEREGTSAWARQRQGERYACQAILDASVDALELASTMAPAGVSSTSGQRRL